MKAPHSFGVSSGADPDILHRTGSGDNPHYYSSDQFLPDDQDTLASSLGVADLMPRPVPALIVDPDQESRYYLRAKLVMAGVLQADEAATGAEALQLLQSRSYRIVLLNIDLPDMDGWLLASQVATRKHWPSLSSALVLFGQKMSWMSQLRGRYAGARSCMRKPLDPSEVASLFRRLDA